METSGTAVPNIFVGKTFVRLNFREFGTAVPTIQHVGTGRTQLHPQQCSLLLFNLAASDRRGDSRTVPHTPHRHTIALKIAPLTMPHRKGRSRWCCGGGGAIHCSSCISNFVDDSFQSLFSVVRRARQGGHAFWVESVTSSVDFAP